MSDWIDRREPDWYVLGPKPSPFVKYPKGIVRHWWLPPAKGSDLWTTLCGARVIGDKHRAGLRRGEDVRKNKRCTECERRKYDLPPIFPKVMK